jgi:electron transport complex protein RnfB
MKELVKALDASLPQTQCGECGFAGCLPYAEALAQGKTTIDRCPPGGISTVNKLAELLAIAPEPYQEKGLKITRKPALAHIKEKECIGCTKCIQACPVDAIIGSAKHMHSIIETECTGCGLCVEPCPVDCIEMQPVAEFVYDKETARHRYQQKKIRRLRQQHEQQQLYREKARAHSNKDEAKAKQDYILAALSRVNAKHS